jgi:hypothetical protein
VIVHLEREVFNHVIANLNRETTDFKAAIIEIKTVKIEIKAAIRGFKEEIIIWEGIIIGAAMRVFCRGTTNFNPVGVLRRREKLSRLGNKKNKFASYRTCKLLTENTEENI